MKPLRAYLHEAAAVPHQQVEAVEVQGLLGDGGAGGDGRAALLHEGQQALHPAAALGRVVHLVQLAQRVRLLAQQRTSYTPLPITDAHYGFIIRTGVIQKLHHTVSVSCFVIFSNKFVYIKRFSVLKCNTFL